MKVYIQSYPDGIPRNYNFMNAKTGFEEMGFETVPFDKPVENVAPEDVIVGYVGTVREHLFKFGIITPEIDYPESLSRYLGRKVWKDKLSHINNNPGCWNIFIKPVMDKQFVGRVIGSTRDLVGCGSCDGDRDIICSEVVNFKAEWRCFVRYGKIIDVRPYKGDWRLHFDYKVIENAIKDYVDAPAGYSADFGLTDDGRTLLIEINDGYALGCYGLFSVNYAKLLSARWAELTHTEDECNF